MQLDQRIALHDKKVFICETQQRPLQQGEGLLWNLFVSVGRSQMELQFSVARKSSQSIFIAQDSFRPIPAGNQILPFFQLM